jgi:competence protein ComEC
MRLFVLAFAGGVWLLQQQAALPVLSVLVGLAGAAVVLLFLSLRLQRPALGLRRFPGTAALLSAAAALGFVWAAGFAHLRLAEELPAAIEGKDIELTGVVAGLPQALERGVRFEFDVEQAPPGVPPHISLAWYRSPEAEDEDASPLVPVRAGERWQLTVRLKRPHGNLNPHGFDYEAWLFERGMRATGYVQAGRGNRRLDAFVWRPAYAVERLRETVRERFLRALPEAPYAGVLVALAVGDQRAIDGRPLAALRPHRDLAPDEHLRAACHDGGGAGAWLVNWLWRRRKADAAPAGAEGRGRGRLVSLTAFAYCLLAGFGGAGAAHALHAFGGGLAPGLGARRRGSAGCWRWL